MMDRDFDTEVKASQDPEFSSEEVREILDDAAWARERIGEEEWARLQRLERFATRAMSAFWVCAASAALSFAAAGAYLGSMWLLWRYTPRPSDLPPAEKSVWELLQFACLLAGIALAAFVVSFLLGRLADQRWRDLLGAGPDADRAMRAGALMMNDAFVKRHVSSGQAKAAEGTAERAEEARAVGEEQDWLQTELSGGHLVWWVAFALGGADWAAGGILPDVVRGTIWATALAGVLLKVGVLPVLAVCHLVFPNRPGVNPRVYYRYLGTGWHSVGLALLPGAADLHLQGWFEEDPLYWLWPWLDAHSTTGAQ